MTTLIYATVADGQLLDEIELHDGELVYTTGAAQPIFDLWQETEQASPDEAFGALTSWSNGYLTIRPINQTAAVEHHEFCLNPLHPGPCKGWKQAKAEGRDHTIIHADLVPAKRHRARKAAAATPKPQPVAPAALTEPAPAGAETSRYNNKPLIENTWGSLVPGSPVHFHEDGEIGQAMRRMGKEVQLDIDGEPLGDILGKIATDAVMGKISSQTAVNRLKALRDHLPEDSRARRALSDAVDELDAPSTPAVDIPDWAPEPLKNLAEDLNKVPLVRKDPSREHVRLARIIDDFQAGRTGSRRLIDAIRGLDNLRHESKEGKFEIDRAVAKAVEELEKMQRADRRSLFPPSTGKNQTAAMHEFCRTPLHPGPCKGWKNKATAGDAPKVAAKKGAAKRGSPRKKATAKAPAVTPGNARAQLAAGVQSGVKEQTELGGGSNADVSRVQFNDGSQAVRKKASNEVISLYSPGLDQKISAKQQTDAEELASLVATAVGVKAPAVHRTAEDDAYFELIDGKPGLEMIFNPPAGWDQRDVAKSDQGILLGLLDVIIDNGDRHEGNWMVDSGGNLVAIDHGQAFQPPPSWADVNIGTDLYGGHFHDQGVWKDKNPMHPDDVAEIRRRLDTIAPEFARLDREDWHEAMMQLVQDVGDRATGTKRRIT